MNSWLLIGCISITGNQGESSVWLWCRQAENGIPSSLIHLIVWQYPPAWEFGNSKGTILHWSSRVGYPENKNLEQTDRPTYCCVIRASHESRELQLDNRKRVCERVLQEYHNHSVMQFVWMYRTVVICNTCVDPAVVLPKADMLLHPVGKSLPTCGCSYNGLNRNDHVWALNAFIILHFLPHDIT